MKLAFSRTASMLICAAALALSCLAARAQEGGDDKQKKDPPAEPEKKHRDPTEASDRMKEALQADEKPIQAAPAVVKVPEMTLKAFVQADGKAATAILDVSGKMQTVHEGSQIRVTNEAGAVLVLVVKSVADGSVTIEVPGLKDSLIVK
jgi:hypothetical protein